MWNEKAFAQMRQRQALPQSNSPAATSKAPRAHPAVPVIAQVIEQGRDAQASDYQGVQSNPPPSNPTRPVVDGNLSVSKSVLRTVSEGIGGSSSPPHCESGFFCEATGRDTLTWGEFSESSEGELPADPAAVRVPRRGTGEIQQPREQGSTGPVSEENVKELTEKTAICWEGMNRDSSGVDGPDQHHSGWDEIIEQEQHDPPAQEPVRRTALGAVGGPMSGDLADLRGTLHGKSGRNTEQQQVAIPGLNDLFSPPANLYEASEHSKNGTGRCGKER